MIFSPGLGMGSMISNQQKKWGRKSNKKLKNRRGGGRIKHSRLYKLQKLNVIKKGLQENAFSLQN